MLLVPVNERRDADKFPALFREGFKAALVHLLILARLRFGGKDGQHFHRRMARKFASESLSEQQDDGGQSDRDEGNAAFHIDRDDAADLCRVDDILIGKL
jgi:hypothetical protein